MVVKPEKHRDRLPVGELHKLVTLEVSEFARLCSQKVAEKKWREFTLRGKAPHGGSVSGVSGIISTNLWIHKLARVELVDPQFLDISNLENLWIHNLEIVGFVNPQVGETRSCV